MKGKNINMKKENGRTILGLLVTLVILIILVGVAIAMVVEKPDNSANTQNQEANNTVQTTIK